MNLRSKVFLTNLIIVLIALLIAGIAFIIAVDNYNLVTVHKYLRTHITSTQMYVSSYLNEKGQGAPSEVLNRDGVFLVEYFAGQVGCDIELYSLSADIDISNNQVLSAARNGNYAYYIERNTDNSRFLYGFPLFSSGNLVGYACFKYPLAETDSVRNEMILLLLIIFLFALAIVSLLNYFFSGWFIKPLEKLKGSASEFAIGDFSNIGALNKVQTGDEIEELAITFGKMGADIQRMLDELKSAQEKQRRFFDSVTHDIRTPLTNIQGYASLINRLEEKDEKEKALHVIDEESNRMLKMMEDLLLLSRMSQFSDTMNYELVDIDLMIEEIAVIMSDKAKKAGINIETKTIEMQIMIDEDKIKRVITNIIDNAIKYSDGNKIKLTMAETNEKLIISIIDNGKGIDRMLINDITEPFVREDKARTAGKGGAGLGLSICKEIVELHNGKLNISNIRPHGLKVDIVLNKDDNIIKF